MIEINEMKEEAQEELKDDIQEEVQKEVQEEVQDKVRKKVLKKEIKEVITQGESIKEMAIGNLRGEKITGMDMASVIANLRPSASKSQSRARSDAGAMSIINSPRNGKRVTISKPVMNKLNTTKTLQIALCDNSIIFGEKLPNNENSFCLRTSGTKSIIYSADLVRELTDEFNFDFSNRVSITLHEVQFDTIEDYPVAIVKVTQ